MSAENLESYIKSAREKGVPDDRIREILTKNGWQLADINRFLVKNGVEEVAIPVPPAPHIGMWVGFLYVILFISLYVSATALSGILHFAVDEISPIAWTR